MPWAHRSSHAIADICEGGWPFFGQPPCPEGWYALRGHRIPAQGANPGNPAGKRDPRSEGTPHNLRVSDIDHGTSYAVFLPNTPILLHAVPRAMPWAGMHCPLRGKLNDDGFRCRGLTAVPTPSQTSAKVGVCFFGSSNAWVTHRIRSRGCSILRLGLGRSRGGSYWEFGRRRRSRLWARIPGSRGRVGPWLW
jgi:hypothetical protein